MEKPKNAPTLLSPLMAKSYSKKTRKTSALVKWLEYEMWTPGQAAMLVSGLCPHPDGGGIPEKGTGVWALNYTFRWGNTEPCKHARQILELWNARESPPDKVTPANFVQWCRKNKINIDWPRAVLPLPEQPTVTEKYIIGSKDLEAFFNLSMNTIRKHAKKHGVEIYRSDDDHSQPMIKMKDAVNLKTNL